MSTTSYTRQLLARWEWRPAVLTFVLIAAESCLVTLTVGLVEDRAPSPNGGRAAFIRSRCSR